MSPAARLSPDPYVGFLFTVQLVPAQLPGGSAICGFSDVSGLNFETEVETMRVGGVNDSDLTLPGPTKFPSRLVLKRGLADTSYLWRWYLEVMQGRILRRGLRIQVHDVEDKDRVRQAWTFKDACPVKWTGPELRASNSAVAFESIELIHRGLQL
jgi:phage tail-like protein